MATRTAKRLTANDVEVGVIYAAKWHPNDNRGHGYWARFDRKVTQLKGNRSGQPTLVFFKRRGNGKVPFGGNEMQALVSSFLRSAGPIVPK